MPISSGSIVRDVTLFVRNIISGNLTDPSAGSRTGTTSEFVMTSHPERNVVYPLITVDTRLGAGRKLGANSQAMEVPVIVEVRVDAKQRGTSDQLSDGVFRVLSQNQTPSGGTELNQMYGFGGGNQVKINEPGKDGIHSTVAEYNWFVVI